MRRRVWCALVVGGVLAGCNAITSIGDYTFEDGDAGGDATTNDANSGVGEAGLDANPNANPDAKTDATAVADTGVDADAGPDANADATVDAGKPTADAAPCTVTSPATGERLMECGSGTCDLDKTSPPNNCCVAPDASAACVDRGTCAQGNFNWECTRAFQCPFPSACCLTVRNLKPTCPPTAEAIQSRCNHADDGGLPDPCNLDFELCTGNEKCRDPSMKCMWLDVVGTGARPVGVCVP